jgi:prepilin-type processing-associated H-X9-DG protein
MRNNEKYNHDTAIIYAYRWYPQAVEACLTMYDWPASAQRSGKPYVGVPSGRHAGGVSAVFADGHAKWVRTGGELCKLERGFIAP